MITRQKTEYMYCNSRHLHIGVYKLDALKKSRLDIIHRKVVRPRIAYPIDALKNRFPTHKGPIPTTAPFNLAYYFASSQLR